MEDDRLSWWQEIVLIVWFVHMPLKYEEYTYWVGAGMRRAYAFEMAKKL